MSDMMQFSHVIYGVSAREKSWLEARLAGDDYPGFDYDFEPAIADLYNLHMFSTTYADSDAVVGFVRAFLHAFRRDDPGHVITFALSSDNVAPENYNGMSVVVTATTEAWFNVEDMASEYLANGRVMPQPRVIDYATTVDELEGSL